MTPPLYNEVLELSLELTNASEACDTKEEWKAYNQLSELCESNRCTNNNHPIQWEALADFTPNPKQAIVIYIRALGYAEQLGLNEYSASINLALAERYYETGNIDQALLLAHKANDLATHSNNTELGKEISGFLLSISSNT